MIIDLVGNRMGERVRVRGRGGNGCKWQASHPVRVV
jgi:hypothetical protein